VTILTRTATLVLLILTLGACAGGVNGGVDDQSDQAAADQNVTEPSQDPNDFDVEDAEVSQPTPGEADTCEREDRCSDLESEMTSLDFALTDRDGYSFRGNVKYLVNDAYYDVADSRPGQVALNHNIVWWLSITNTTPERNATLGGLQLQLFTNAEFEHSASGMRCTGGQQPTPQSWCSLYGAAYLVDQPITLGPGETYTDVPASDEWLTRTVSEDAADDLVDMIVNREAVVGSSIVLLGVGTDNRQATAEGRGFVSQVFDSSGTLLADCRKVGSEYQGCG
jgi:hypothetical protein